MKKLTYDLFLGDERLQDVFMQRICYFDSMEIDKSFKNQIEMIEELNRTKPDLLFINIDQDDVKAVEVLKLIQRPAFIIAITNNKLRVPELLDNGYFDFLTPKLNLDVFCKKMSKILNISGSLAEKNLFTLNEPEPEYAAPKKKSTQSNSIFLKYGKTRCRLTLEDIAIAQKNDKGVKIETTRGKVAYHDSTLKKLESSLPKDLFMRINKSVIVNFTKIEKFEQNTVFVCRQAFEVSRIFAPALREQIRKNMVEFSSAKFKKNKKGY